MIFVDDEDTNIGVLVRHIYDKECEERVARWSLVLFRIGNCLLLVRTSNSSLPKERVGCVKGWVEHW